MLQVLRAYSSWSSVEEALLDPSGSPANDLYQITDIEGLGPVAAEITTSQLGSMDGDSFVGTRVGYRNIVLSINPNPNWDNWTYERLRDLLYTYFMPQRRVRLVFETDEKPPVEISGYVESNEPKLFSKTGEISISVICPDPHFIEVDPTVILGVANEPEIFLDYDGSVQSGIEVQVSHTSGLVGTRLEVQVGDQLNEQFKISGGADATKYILMSSVPGQKYVQSVAIPGGEITNILSSVDPISTWPLLRPGSNRFQVVTDQGDPDWRLTYYRRYGGL